MPNPAGALTTVTGRCADSSNMDRRRGRETRYGGGSGAASFVVGTHTHVPTADAQILNGGTAYMSDAGMCGDYDSSLGMDKEEPLNRFISKMPKGRMEAANGPATICGVGVEISDTTGLAEKIAPLRLGPRLAETVPEFWR